MDSLTCNVAGTTFNLKADGSVTDSSQSNVGHWNSADTTPASNALVLSLTTAADVTLTAQYTFNTNNQLLVSLQNSDGSFTPLQVLNGRLVVHNNQDVGYRLVDESGNDLAGAITVHGKMRLDGNNDLTINLAGGGVAVINLDQVSTGLNNGSGTGDDVMTLSATSFDFGGNLMMPADISLPGSFKPAGDNLVFELNGNAGVNLTFSGTFKGTSVGFEYHQGSGATTLVFTVSGSYRWDGGKAAFTVFFGNSANGFTAQGSLSVATTFDGGKGSLNGTLTFSAAGGTFNIDLTLNVQQKWDANNCILFNVEFQDVNGHVSYDLGVEGTAKFLDGTLTFDLKFSSTGALTIDLGYTGQDLSIAVDLTFNQGVPSAGITLSVTISFQNGQRVKSPVQVTPAPAVV
jgi:hypothetical protein